MYLIPYPVDMCAFPSRWFMKHTYTLIESSKWRTTTNPKNGVYAISKLEPFIVTVDTFSHDIVFERFNNERGKRKLYLLMDMYRDISEKAACWL